MYDNVGTLTYRQCDKIGLIGDYGHEIVGNDRHFVSVDGEPDESLRGVIDQSEAMCLARVELELCRTSVWRASQGGRVARVAVFTVDELYISQHPYNNFHISMLTILFDIGGQWGSHDSVAKNISMTRLS